MVGPWAYISARFSGVKETTSSCTAKGSGREWGPGGNYRPGSYVLPHIQPNPADFYSCTEAYIDTKGVFSPE